MTSRTRNRWVLVLIAVLFLLPFAAAVVMRFGGWQPPQTRNHGHLLAPPIDMADVQALRGDGSAWAWQNTEQQWTLLVRTPSPCAESCRAALRPLPNVREALGRHAGRLHLFRIDDLAGDASLPGLQLQGDLPAALTTPLDDAMPEVWLVDPHGYLVMQYPPGFDPAGLRRDLARLLR